MKKTLFFLLAAGVVGSLEAQSNAPAKSNSISVTPVQAAQMRAKARQEGAKAQPANNNANNTKRPQKAGASPTLPFLGSSANINGVLDASTTAVTANEACSLIVMTHRNNNSNVAICGSGAYNAAYSTNGGTLWDTTVTLFCNNDPLKGTRYPNGVIFNPAGNVNPANAYDVVSGPYTNAAAAPAISWVASVYGSATFGDANNHGMYWTNGTANYISTQNTGDLSYMSSSDDSTVHVMGEGFKENAAKDTFRVWLGGVLTTGKFNGKTDSFNWNQTVFHPHIVPSYIGFTNALSVYDSDAAPLNIPGTAWSQDGKTGYVVFFANADSAGYNYYTDQPIVYKTTNSGVTWNMMPLFNFRNLPSLTQHLEATNDSAGVKIPMWYAFNTTVDINQGAVDNIDLTVDYKGNLHIFGVIVSSTLCSPDSSYTVSFHANQDGYIYDVYTTSAIGGWQARFIDSMFTTPINNAYAGGLSGLWDSTKTSYVGLGNRLQASRTTDGKHIFCTWEDDLSGSVPNRLAFPDAFGQGYDVATSTAGGVYQFTNTSDNYFLCVSDIVLTSVNAGDTTYTVPCTIGYPSPSTVANNNLNDGSEPINYYYLDSVVYSSTLGSTSGVKTIAQSFSIGPNYPNPFTGVTQFNIGLTNENLVSVDVYNLFGQKVYSIPAQQMSSGNHLMSINASGWSAGVYLYRVTVGDQAKTQKMVVQ